MPKGFSDSEKTIIHERLLQQGSRLFSAYGLKKTNVEEIAKAAGISKGAFYLFWPSKEALFMEVVEQTERNFRQDVLAVIDLPGPSPRARLVAVLQKAFSLWKTIPILQFFTSADYEIITRRVAGEVVAEHLHNDHQFIDDLVLHCRQSGIPIQAPAEQIGGLMYALFFTSLHEEDLQPGGLTGTLDTLVELVAAYCLGEIKTQPQ
jgi:AcrR family transcriptional regulator